MDQGVRRSGLTLALAGLCGAAFFLITDPRFGPQRLAYDVIDRVNQAHVGTVVGIVGSLAVLVIGLWLMTRKTT
jgi:hypothetical protein